MSDKIPLADVRKSYELSSLEEHEIANEPLKQFQSWLAEAFEHKVLEPNAMTLSTVGSNGRPSSRIVLIKGCDERGLVWFTNYESRKGQELAGKPFAALQFHWVALERVVRIEGHVEKVDPKESDEYYVTRPLASRIGAWASPQSAVIDGRGQVLAKAAEYGLKYGLNPPRPPHWGGYRLVPDSWEFWQGRVSRLHDRIAYRRNDKNEWIKVRLAP